MPVLARMIRETRDRARMCNLVRVERNVAEQAREQLAMLEAIAARDADGARAAMVEHGNRVRERLHA